MKKIISLVLSVCMVLALVPTISFAVEQDGIQPDTADNEVVQEVAEEGDTSEYSDLEAAESIGWQKDETGWKYLNESGVPVLGKKLIGGADYYFDESTGYLMLKWITDTDGNRYYADPNGTQPGEVGSSYGVLKKGWFTDSDGSKYYFDMNTCRMKTGWLTENGKKYYFDKTGKMHTKWLKLNGYKYYFNANGVMYTGKKTIGKYTYFFDQNNGKMHTGWIDYNGYRYFCRDNGHMKTGWLTQNGKKYYLNDKGHMVTGLKTLSTKKGKGRYYFNTNGVMQTGPVKINGNLFYFFSSGKAVSSKGWFKGSDKKTRYSLGTKGKVATGKKQIGSNRYLFDKNTGVCKKNLGDSYDMQIKNKTSKTQYLIQVIKSKYQTRVYKGSKGNWSKIYTFSCAIGKSGYETQSGTFTVKGKTKIKNYKDNKIKVHWDNGVNYYDDSHGFNSPVYTGWDTMQGDLYDGRLGGKYTRGRVRLSYNNSLWLYNNIGKGTTVYIH